MTHSEMIAENERSRAEHAAVCAKFERQAAHYRAISAAAQAAIDTMIDQMNVPWRAFAEELKGKP